MVVNAWKKNKNKSELEMLGWGDAVILSRVLRAGPTANMTFEEE